LSAYSSGPKPSFTSLEGERNRKEKKKRREGKGGGRREEGGRREGKGRREGGMEWEREKGRGGTRVSNRPSYSSYCAN